MTECITTIYEPPEHEQRYPQTARLILWLIDHAAALDRIFAVDYATPYLLTELEKRGRIVTITAGRPPRMNLLLAEAFRHVHGGLFWTIEQDARISQKVAEKTERAFCRLPDDTAGLFLPAYNYRGERTEPLKRDRGRCKGTIPGTDGFAYYDHAPFCATLWRREAFEEIDFTRTPPHNRCDLAAGRQLRRYGWRTAMASSAYPCLHYSKSSYAVGTYNKREVQRWTEPETPWLR